MCQCSECAGHQYEPSEVEIENAKLREELAAAKDTDARLRDCLVHERTRVTELIDRAEAAEAKIKAAEEQEPVAYAKVVSSLEGEYLVLTTYETNKPLFAKPIPPEDLQELQREVEEVRKRNGVLSDRLFNVERKQLVPQNS